MLYLVIQSGANIDILNKKNVGNFNLYTLQKSVELCENNGLYSKEHNSDFFTKEDISIRFVENELNFKYIKKCLFWGSWAAFWGLIMLLRTFEVLGELRGALTAVSGPETP